MCQIAGDCYKSVTLKWSDACALAEPKCAVSKRRHFNHFNFFSWWLNQLFRPPNFLTNEAPRKKDTYLSSVLLARICHLIAPRGYIITSPRSGTVRRPCKKVSVQQSADTPKERLNSAAWHVEGSFTVDGMHQFYFSPLNPLTQSVNRYHGCEKCKHAVICCFEGIQWI